MVFFHFARNIVSFEKTGKSLCSSRIFKAIAFIFEAGSIENLLRGSSY
jgi:hypothetical protein